MVRQDVLALYHHRRLWREMRPALVTASTHSTTFLTHYDNLYVSTQVAAIRRLSDTSPHAASLVRLLGSLARFAHLVTGERWVSLAKERDPNIDNHWLEQLRIDFARRWGKPGTAHLDRARVVADRDTFAAVSLNAKVYADNAIAHRHDGVFDSAALTYADLDAAIDQAGVLLRRYEAVLNDTHLAALEPVTSGDWFIPFRRPLFGTEHRPPHEDVLDPAPPWPNRPT